MNDVNVIHIHGLAGIFRFVCVTKFWRKAL